MPAVPFSVIVPSFPILLLGLRMVTSLGLLASFSSLFPLLLARAPMSLSLFSALSLLSPAFFPALWLLLLAFFSPLSRLLLLTLLWSVILLVPLCLLPPASVTPLSLAAFGILP